jgi:Glycosyl transferase family 2
MKLVMTLLARDEADIVDAQVAFHLHAGVDFVIATDNRSSDGTTEILERYERAGFLHLLHEDGDDLRQGESVTRMARMAATDFGADWVINSDADEFWWPRGGSLEDVLATVPERYGVVRGCWRHYLPRPDDGAFFADRMIVRLARPAFPGDKSTIYHAHQKVAHRADPGVTVETGNHNALGVRMEPIRAWHPLEVLHFSFRSLASLSTKNPEVWLRNVEHPPTLHQRLLATAAREGRLREFYERFVVSDEALASGLEDGTLAIDTRLRDALRTIRGQNGEFRLPAAGTPPALDFPRPVVEDDAAYAAEVTALIEVDGIVRAKKRVEAVERRLASLEHGPLRRLRTLAPR